jgi:hypothetical protein
MPLNTWKQNEVDASRRFTPALLSGSSEGDFSIFVFDLMALRPANFADRNERQHAKDRKSDHHRATPGYAPRPIVMPQRRLFALKRCPSNPKFEHDRAYALSTHGDEMAWPPPSWDEWNCRRWGPSLQAEIKFFYNIVFHEPGSCFSFEHDTSVYENVATVGDAACLAKVLPRHQYCELVELL